MSPATFYENVYRTHYTLLLVSWSLVCSCVLQPSLRRRTSPERCFTPCARTWWPSLLTHAWWRESDTSSSTETSCSIHSPKEWSGRNSSSENGKRWRLHCLVWWVWKNSLRTAIHYICVSFKKEANMNSRLLFVYQFNDIVKLVKLLHILLSKSGHLSFYNVSQHTSNHCNLKQAPYKRIIVRCQN